jgi:hypothetical protein
MPTVKGIVGFDEHTIYQVEYNTEGNSFHVGVTEYDLFSFTEEQGEEMARDCLVDNELWMDAVANGNTTLGENDWVEQVMNIDGWMHIIGDIEELTIGGGIGGVRYTRWSGWTHEIPRFNDMMLTYLNKDDYDFMCEVMNKLNHLIPRDWIAEHVKERVTLILLGLFRICDFEYYNRAVHVKDYITVHKLIESATGE